MRCVNTRAQYLGLGDQGASILQVRVRVVPSHLAAVGIDSRVETHRVGLRLIVT